MLSERGVSIVIAVIGLLGSISGSYFTAKSVARASDVEIVKLAIDLLQKKDTPTGMKEWSLGILSTYTAVPLTQEQRESIVSKVDALPSFEDYINGKSTIQGWKTIDDPDWRQIIEQVDPFIIQPPPEGFSNK